MDQASLESVQDAIEILTGEVQDACDSAYSAVKLAADEHDVAGIKCAVEKAELLEGFAERVSDLLKDWERAFDKMPEVLDEQAGTEADGAPRRFYGRLTKGLRTREEAFYVPILQSLVARGGSATVGEVTADVEKEIGHMLNEFDRQPLKSSGHAPRWKNAVQWARYELVRKGLMRRSNAHGVWEISESGRVWISSESGSVTA